MLNIELKEGTPVVTADGQDVGRINRFVLDPATNEVTHIVVQKGWLLTEDKVVPFEMVASSTEGKLVLSEELKDVDQLPPFEETHYVPANEERNRREEPREGVTGENVPVYYWYPPHGYMGFPAYGLGQYAWPRVETQQNIPGNTVPLKEGTNVLSSDDEHVGNVERLFVEPDSSTATHFLISQGLLFKNHKLVPVNWIRSVSEDNVQLGVSSQLLEILPDYED